MCIHTHYKHVCILDYVVLFPSVHAIFPIHNKPMRYYYDCTIGELYEVQKSKVIYQSHVEEGWRVQCDFRYVSCHCSSLYLYTHIP